MVRRVGVRVCDGWRMWWLVVGVELCEEEVGECGAGHGLCHLEGLGSVVEVVGLCLCSDGVAGEGVACGVEVAVGL